VSQVFHPDFGQVVNYTSQQLSDCPDQQVDSTIGAMRQLALADAPHMQSEAQQALQYGNGCPVTGVFNYVKGKMRFQLDEQTADSINQFIPQSSEKPIVEILIRPRDLSQLCLLQNNGIGDCDDYSMYAACLLIALGVSCSFATVAASSSDPSAYSHVYVVAYPNGQRVPLDCSHGPYAGWEAPNKYGKFREWPINGSSGMDGCIPWLLIAGVAVAFAYVNKKGKVS
jgi:hypothetical protein